MAKVSKNLKKIRKEKGMTQEELAQKINVTRQAISNWENDKSQPDIEALKKISDILQIEIEELIYGEKRNVGIESDKAKEKNRIKIILSIIGSVFIGVGLVLVFFNFWNDFGLPVQSVFSMLPLLASQAFALFVFFKKREKLHWRESSGLILTIGVISTIALINYVFGIYCGYEACILIDALMCIPIIFVLNSVGPLAVCYFLAINWTFLSNNIAAGAALFVLISLYVFYLYKKDDERFLYSQWVGTIALTAFSVISFSIIFAGNDGCVLSALICVFLVLYLLSKNSSNFSSPFKTLGIVGISFVMLWTSFMYISSYNSFFNGFHSNKIATEIIAFSVSLIIIAVSAIIKRKDFRENIYKTLIGICSALFVALSFIISIFKLKLLMLIIPALTIIIGILIIIKGVKDLKLLYINFGLIVCFIQIIEHLSVVNLNLIIFGAAFVVFGACLISINTIIFKKRKNIILADNSEVAEK